MGVLVIVYGRSGVGKSYSLKGFKQDEVFLVNVLGKPLPFRGQWKYQMATQRIETILAGLKRMPTRSAVVDDAGYIMSSLFMAGHGGKQSDQFALYNQIADSMWALVRCVQDLPPDRIVYLMMHEETNDYGDSKLLTIGKLLDQKINLSGCTTITLHAMSDGEKYFFRARNNGHDLAKSPVDMFEGPEIENDLAAVDRIIREYYEFPALGEPVQASGAASVTKSEKVSE